MKLTIAICTFLIGFTLQAQEIIPYQFWTNLSHFNPAHAGLEHQRQGGIMHQADWNTESHDFFGFYNQRLKKNVGVGLNMSYSNSFVFDISEISTPISYDWNIKGKHHLALGVAPTYRNQTTPVFEISMDSLGNSTLVDTGEKLQRNSLQTHLGITYNMRNLYVGLGVRNMNIASSGNFFTNPFRPHYYGHMTFEVPLQITSFKIKQRAFFSTMYTYVDGFARLDLNWRSKWENGLNVFVGGRVRDGWTIGGGWDFFDKLLCLYSTSFQRSPLSNNVRFTHQLSVQYHLPIEAD